MTRLEQAEVSEKSPSASFSALLSPELQTANVPVTDKSSADSLTKTQFGTVELLGVQQSDTRLALNPLAAVRDLGTAADASSIVTTAQSGDRLSFTDDNLFKSVFGQDTERVEKPTLVADIRLFEGLPANVKQHFERIRDGVTDSFNTPFANRTKDLNGLEVIKDLTIGGYLGKNTTEPPMFDSAYSAKVTIPYEQKLMKDLLADQGPISQKELVERAMTICNNDKYLATLTLANFTKNIASVERGQAPVTDVPRPDMGYPFDTFSRKQSDNVFDRLEKFDEVASAKNKLSKIDAAGTLYHFYGGILASSAGLGFEVHGENAIFGWKRDPIKREAGSLGDDVGRRVFGPGQQLNDAFKNMLR